MACTYLHFPCGFDLLINKWGKKNTFRVELEAHSLTVPRLCLPGPLVKCDFWICCSSVISMSNMALSCHCRIELRKNQAGEENPHPGMYLWGGEENNGNDQVTGQRFLRSSLPPLIQNIILSYCSRTRRHILRSGDSLSFPENTMDRGSPCEVTDLPPDQVQAKLLTSHSVFPEAQQVLAVGEGPQGGWLLTSLRPSHKVSGHRPMRSASRHFRRFGAEAKQSKRSRWGEGREHL